MAYKNTFIVSQFLRVRKLGSFLRVSQLYIRVSTGLGSSLELGGLFQGHMAVGRIQFVGVEGLTVVPTLLLAANQGPLSSPEAAPSLTCGTVTTRQLRGQQKNLSSSSLRGSLIQCSLIKGVRPHHLHHIPLASHRFCLHSRRGVYSRA